MLSESTYRSNYWKCGETYYARPARHCKTADLIRERYELEDMFCSGRGDDDKIEKRIKE